ncbi:MAG TPA: radical SAM protein [Candidatus Eisenbacteria bacterium]|nr:radical SAM protein [Candidatus Eisenbacteria bacterium]
MTGAPNAVQLKIALATRGVRIDDRMRAELGLVPDFTPTTLDLVLPGDVRVIAPIENGALAAYAVVAEHGRAHVVGDDTVRVEVRTGSIPRFYGRRTSAGRPMWQVGTVHGAHLLVTPTATCGFSVRGAPCSFCREGARPPGERESAISIAEVIEVVRAAFEEGAADFVYFNSSVFDAEDGGIGFLTPYVEAVRKHFDTFVAVQVHPPRTNAWIERTYAMGVDALSYNLELFDPQVLDRHCIGRMRYIGRERYLEALAHAASVFPAGTVWSDLVLGIEPAASTMAGIDALAAMGVVPVLSMYHPAGGTAPEVTAEDAASVGGHLYRTARERKLTMTWVRDLALGITPFEASQLTGEAAPGGAVQALTRSRLGAFAARGLARFRRRLRVRAISDSLDSSHL